MKTNQKLIITFITVLFLFVTTPSFSQSQKEAEGFAKIYAQIIVKIIEQVQGALNEYIMKTFNNELLKEINTSSPSTPNLSCKISEWPPLNDSCISTAITDEDLTDGTAGSIDILNTAIGYDDDYLYFKLNSEDQIKGEETEKHLNFYGFVASKNQKNENYAVICSPTFYPAMNYSPAILAKVSNDKVELLESTIDYSIDGNNLYLRLKLKDIGMTNAYNLYLIGGTAALSSLTNAVDFKLKDFSQTILFTY